MAQAIRDTDINAVYPDPRPWLARMDEALRRSQVQAGKVRDAAGYRAVLEYFAAQLKDAHLFVTFSNPSKTFEWPGFLARQEDGRYRVTASVDGSSPDGEDITACDGKPMSSWIETVSDLEIAPPASLESSKATAAARLFLDRGSPLRARPTSCTINGQSTLLHWRPVDAAAIKPTYDRLRGKRDVVVGTELLGRDGAWVTLGYFQPTNAEQAVVFRKAIAEAPTLRQRSFIVLDVRGNGGGPYNWFMAYLRGLYGTDYADYYSTARLRIRGVYRQSAFLAAASSKMTDAKQTASQPPDPPFEINRSLDDRTEMNALATHQAFWKAAAIPYARPGPPPANPVRGQVYVLTDAGCGSACIGFVDELKHFPGVRQIGMPTYVDNRTGTAVPTPLPSGEATVFAPMMTRDGRVRGDNVPQMPDIRYRGDGTDKEAVRDWVLKEVVRR